VQDLTQGSIPRHVLKLAAPIAIGMLFQTLYFLIDLYFVATLGEAAIAGVGAAGSLQFIVMALTQALGIGTMALIAHAVGRKDRDDANRVANQGLGLALIATLATLVGGYVFAGRWMDALSEDTATIAAGRTYLVWLLPGMSLQFAFTVMVSALRGTGIAKPTMLAQVATVGLNALFAPILISGWLTGLPLGVAGAGLATTLAVAIGFGGLWLYFARAEQYVRFDRSVFAPRIDVWKRILAIGLPPGGEFALMFVIISAIYYAIRGFGPDAQAGFAVGLRVMQAVFLPAMAIAFAAAPVAGQNMGAGQHARVRETFRVTATIGSVAMLVLTLLCQWQPEWLVAWASGDREVVAVAAGYLGVTSWNFVASGLIFTCSGLFQALGNTLPSLAASASRLVTFVLPALWLSTRPGFELRQLWWLSVTTVLLQALCALFLLRRELNLASPPKLGRAPLIRLS